MPRQYKQIHFVLGQISIMFLLEVNLIKAKNVNWVCHFCVFLAITTTMFTDIELIITRLLLIHSPACCHVTWGFTVGRPKGNGLELFSG